jgi:hypothetical protein
MHKNHSDCYDSATYFRYGTINLNEKTSKGCNIQ